MNIEGKMRVVEIGKKGLYKLECKCGDVALTLSAFFSNKVEEKVIKKIDEDDELLVKGFTSIRASKSGEYTNYNDSFIITDCSICK